MPAWLIPAIKAVLPHVGTIVSAAKPVFTKKGSDVSANQSTLLQQQITELQAAASANDANIKALAAQIKTTVEALDQGASLAERRHQRTQFFSIVALVVSLAALCTAGVILLAR